MSVRKRALTIIVITFVLLGVTMYFVSERLILDSFKDVEEDNTRQNTERALNFLKDDEIALNAFNYDWSAWDDTYQFITDGNQEFIDTNLAVDTSFLGTRINLMVFVNAANEIVYQKAYDLENQEEAAFSASFREYTASSDSLLRHESLTSSIYGMILLPEGPMLVSSEPIITSGNEGPIRGSMIVGRYLSDAEIERVSKATRLPLSFHVFNVSDPDPDLGQAKTFLAENAGIFVKPANGDVVAGYGLLNDIDGNPILIMKAEMPRDIYNEGRTTIGYFLWSLVAIGLAIGGVTLVILDKVVLHRLSKLAKRVFDIKRSGDMQKRVSMSGCDEIASLASEINSLLDSIEIKTGELSATNDELRQAQGQLQEMNRHLEGKVKERTEDVDRLLEQKQAFISQLAHDLRSPLTPMVGLLPLIRDKQNDEEALEFLDAISDSVGYMRGLVDETLELAVLGSRKIQLSIRKVNLADAIDTLISRRSLTFSERNITVENKVKSHTIVSADELRLVEVIDNLVSNALKVMPDGGALTFEASDEGEFHLITVRDTGVGLTAEQMEPIFDEFYKADRSRHDHGSAGLGLTICERIIELHEGKIWAESDGIGKGAAFRFTLPIL